MYESMVSGIPQSLSPTRSRATMDISTIDTKDNVIDLSQYDSSSDSEDFPSLFDWKEKRAGVIKVESEVDSPVKDGDPQGKRKMDGAVSSRKLLLPSTSAITIDDSSDEEKSLTDSTCSTNNDCCDLKTNIVTKKISFGSSGRTSLTPDIWWDVECQHVEKLPHDIDGLVKFQLPFEKENRMKSTKDGRPWSGFMTSRRSGFKGIRRIARCRGSMKCMNDDCQYLKQFNKRNRAQFLLKSDERICQSCGAAAVNVECPASKVWEFNDDANTVLVYHHGIHTCLPNVPNNISSEMYDDAQSIFKATKKIGAKAYASSQIIQAVEEGKGLDDVLSVASAMAPGKINSIKNKVKQSMNSSGHSFDAIAKYKTTTDKLDKYLIYRAHNGKLSSGPSYIFKTSETQLRMALDMDKDCGGLLQNEVCFADGNHKRCPVYITLTLWVYHSLLKQMAKLATMETESEGKENIRIFWRLLNEGLRELTGNNTYKFNPKGVMVDEGGGWWASIPCELPDGAIDRTISCEKHWKFTVKRIVTAINASYGKDVGDEFEDIANGILKSATPNMYEAAKCGLERFQQKYPVKELVNWWGWWEKRRYHVFRAFRPNLNAPKVNLAESGHSSWKNSGIINLDLLDAARQDVAENLQLRANLKGYEQGTYSGGNGPTHNVLSKRSYAEQHKRAQAFSNELLDYMDNGLNPPQPKSSEIFVDESSSHRHDPPRRSKGSQSAKAASKPTKRPCSFRKSRSKNFTRVLEIAMKMKSISVSEVVVNNHERHFTVSTGGSISTYDVKIKSNPDCSCRYCTDRDVCSHIVWLLLHRFKIPVQDDVLQQKGYTSHELERIFATKGSATKETSSEKASSENCMWLVSKHSLKTRPRCPTCHVEMKEGDLKITCHARWTPPHKTKEGKSFTVPRVFHFCLSWQCISSDPPKDSSIKRPPHQMKLDADVEFSADEWDLIVSQDFPLCFDD